MMGPLTPCPTCLTASCRVIFGGMPQEPQIKRVIAFFDGQNLYHSCKQTFGYSYPNYDPLALTQCICHDRKWQLAQVRFYTGIPSAKDNLFWNEFWSAKLSAMGRRGIWVYSRLLRYRSKTMDMPGQPVFTFEV